MKVRDPFAAAELGYAGFPAQTIEHDAAKRISLLIRTNSDGNPWKLTGFQTAGKQAGKKAGIFGRPLSTSVEPR